MDTASNAGPRFPGGGFADNFPHAVPSVPAPKLTAGEEVEEEGDEEARVTG